MMTDEQLVAYVADFREGILDDGPSDKMCAAVCWPLVTPLNMLGVNCRAIESDLEEINHVWILLEDDGRVLDPTLDQFNYLFDEQFPQVYLGPPTKYHQVTSKASTKTTAKQNGAVRSPRPKALQ